MCRFQLCMHISQQVTDQEYKSKAVVRAQLEKNNWWKGHGWNAVPPGQECVWMLAKLTLDRTQSKFQQSPNNRNVPAKPEANRSWLFWHVFRIVKTQLNVLDGRGSHRGRQEALRAQGEWTPAPLEQDRHMGNGTLVLILRKGTEASSAHESHRQLEKLANEQKTRLRDREVRNKKCVNKIKTPN